MIKQSTKQVVEKERPIVHSQLVKTETKQVVEKERPIVHSQLVKTETKQVVEKERLIVHSRFDKTETKHVLEKERPIVQSQFNKTKTKALVQAIEGRLVSGMKQGVEKERPIVHSQLVKTETKALVRDIEGRVVSGTKQVVEKERPIVHSQFDKPETKQVVEKKIPLTLERSIETPLLELLHLTRVKPEESGEKRESGSILFTEQRSQYATEVATKQVVEKEIPLTPERSIQTPLLELLHLTRVKPEESGVDREPGSILFTEQRTEYATDKPETKQVVEKESLIVHSQFDKPETKQVVHSQLVKPETKSVVEDIKGRLVSGTKQVVEKERPIVHSQLVKTERKLIVEKERPIVHSQFDKTETKQVVEKEKPLTPERSIETPLLKLLHLTRVKPEESGEKRESGSILFTEQRSQYATEVATKQVVEKEKPLTPKPSIETPLLELLHLTRVKPEESGVDREPGSILFTEQRTEYATDKPETKQVVEKESLIVHSQFDKPETKQVVEKEKPIVHSQLVKTETKALVRDIEGRVVSGTKQVVKKERPIVHSQFDKPETKQVVEKKIPLTLECSIETPLLELLHLTRVKPEGSGVNREPGSILFTEQRSEYATEVATKQVVEKEKPLTPKHSIETPLLELLHLTRVKPEESGVDRESGSILFTKQRTEYATEVATKQVVEKERPILHSQLVKPETKALVRDIEGRVVSGTRQVVEKERPIVHSQFDKTEKKQIVEKERPLTPERSIETPLLELLHPTRVKPEGSGVDREPGSILFTKKRAEYATEVATKQVVEKERPILHSQFDKTETKQVVEKEKPIVHSQLVEPDTKALVRDIEGRVVSGTKQVVEKERPLTLERSIETPLLELLHLTRVKPEESGEKRESGSILFTEQRSQYATELATKQVVEKEKPLTPERSIETPLLELLHLTRVKPEESGVDREPGSILFTEQRTEYATDKPETKQVVEKESLIVHSQFDNPETKQVVEKEKPIVHSQLVKTETKALVRGIEGRVVSGTKQVVKKERPIVHSQFDKPETKQVVEKKIPLTLERSIETPLLELLHLTRVKPEESGEKRESGSILFTEQWSQYATEVATKQNEEKEKPIVHSQLVKSETKQVVEKERPLTPERSIETPLLELLHLTRVKPEESGVDREPGSILFTKQRAEYATDKPETKQVVEKESLIVHSQFDKPETKQVVHSQVVKPETKSVVEDIKGRLVSGTKQVVEKERPIVHSQLVKTERKQIVEKERPIVHSQFDKTERKQVVEKEKPLTPERSIETPLLKLLHLTRVKPEESGEKRESGSILFTEQRSQYATEVATKQVVEKEKPLTPERSIETPLLELLHLTRVKPEESGVDREPGSILFTEQRTEYATDKPETKQVVEKERPIVHSQFDKTETKQVVEKEKPLTPERSIETPLLELLHLTRVKPEGSGVDREPGSILFTEQRTEYATEVATKQVVEKEKPLTPEHSIETPLLELLHLTRVKPEGSGANRESGSILFTKQRAEYATEVATKQVVEKERPIVHSQFDKQRAMQYISAQKKPSPKVDRTSTGLNLGKPRWRHRYITKDHDPKPTEQVPEQRVQRRDTPNTLGSGRYVRDQGALESPQEQSAISPGPSFYGRSNVRGSTDISEPEKVEESSSWTKPAAHSHEEEPVGIPTELLPERPSKDVHAVNVGDSLQHTTETIADLSIQPPCVYPLSPKVVESEGGTVKAHLPLTPEHSIETPLLELLHLTRVKPEGSGVDREQGSILSTQQRAEYATEVATKQVVEKERPIVHSQFDKPETKQVVEKEIPLTPERSIETPLLELLHLTRVKPVVSGVDREPGNILFTEQRTEYATDKPETKQVVEKESLIVHSQFDKPETKQVVHSHLVEPETKSLVEDIKGRLVSGTKQVVEKERPIVHSQLVKTETKQVVEKERPIVHSQLVKTERRQVVEKEKPLTPERSIETPLLELLHLTRVKPEGSGANREPGSILFTEQWTEYATDKPETKQVVEKERPLTPERSIETPLLELLHLTRVKPEGSSANRESGSILFTEQRSQYATEVATKQVVEKEGPLTPERSIETPLLELLHLTRVKPEGSGEKRESGSILFTKPRSQYATEVATKQNEEKDKAIVHSQLHPVKPRSQYATEVATKQNEEKDRDKTGCRETETDRTQSLV